LLTYIIRRVLYALPIALSVSFICFMLVHIAPGDPISAIVPPDAPPDVIQQVRVEYGLDRPLVVQFGIWLRHVAAGDLGRSLTTGRPVLVEIREALGNTVALGLTAAIPGFLFASLIGAVAAWNRGSWLDRGISGFAVAAVSIPYYWLGIVLVIVFSVYLNWLPAMGAGSAGAGGWHFNWNNIQYYILPAVTLVVIPMGIVTRTVRGNVSEILSQDFMVTLVAKGLRRRTMLVHVIKNAAPNTITVMGLQFGYLIAGSILVETVFAWPGTGLLLKDAIFQRDIPLLQGIVLVLSIFFVALNLMVDILQTILDPRIKRHAGQ
jgi:peptide/nickel transport system permease protein